MEEEGRRMGEGRGEEDGWRRRMGGGRGEEDG